ncbi:MAG: hypothetical protein KKA05_04160 [Alphaproteobacteria bacterium]|nr:hypothetical protein [Alphaproteobacteria bacterium]MBU0859711.1 hypothetical protein [Alphaproteobacteria bacterium]
MNKSVKQALNVAAIAASFGIIGAVVTGVLPTADKPNETAAQTADTTTVITPPRL